MAELPTRAEIKLKLSLLLDGYISRDSISKWAEAIINNEGIVVTDQLAWKILIAVGGADLHGLTKPYLYDEEDFRCWRAEL
jgi:hypothetical protein